MTLRDLQGELTTAAADGQLVS